jgi:hypothetical protein
MVGFWSEASPGKNTREKQNQRDWGHESSGRALAYEVLSSISVP